MCIGRNNCKRSSSTLKHHHSTFNIRLFQQRLVRAMVFILVLLLLWLQQLVMVRVLHLQQELILLLVFIQLQLLRLGDFQQVRRTFFLYKIIKIIQLYISLYYSFNKYSDIKLSQKIIIVSIQIIKGWILTQPLV